MLDTASLNRHILHCTISKRPGENLSKTTESNDVFVCQLCPKNAINERLLLKHYDVAHRRLNQFNCGMCSSTFKTKFTARKSSLFRHYREVHDIDPLRERKHNPSNVRIIPPYVEDDCSDSSPKSRMKKYWQNYFIKHFVVRRFPCPYCKRILTGGLGKFANFYKHIKAKHLREAQADINIVKDSYEDVNIDNKVVDFSGIANERIPTSSIFRVIPSNKNKNSNVSGQDTTIRDYWKNYFNKYCAVESCPCPYCDRIMSSRGIHFGNFYRHLETHKSFTQMQSDIPKEANLDDHHDSLNDHDEYLLFHPMPVDFNDLTAVTIYYTSFKTMAPCIVCNETKESSCISDYIRHIQMHGYLKNMSVDPSYGTDIYGIKVRVIATA